MHDSERSLKHWKLLSHAIKSSHYACIHKNASGTSSSEYDDVKNKLFIFEPIESLNQHSDDKYIWFQLIPKSIDEKQCDTRNNYTPSPIVRLYKNIINFNSTNSNANNLQIISGFDNTGNVNLWPCELLLSHSIISPHYYPELWFNQVDRALLKQPVRTVCELGSGMTGLASLACLLSMQNNPIFCNLEHVILTDGNDYCIDSMQAIVEKYDKIYNCENKSVRVEVKYLRWSSEDKLTDQTSNVPSNLQNYFDLILASDIFFNSIYHRSLLQTIDMLLNQRAGSLFIAIAPLRDNTLMSFIQTIRENQGRFKLNFKLISPENYLSKEFKTYLIGDSNRANFAQEELNKYIGHLLLLSRI